jgi:mono/diheme cytochrome c family protein
MAKTIVGVIVVLLLIGLVPFGLIALSRSRPSPTRPPHPILDMVRQPKFKTQRPNPMFADDRAMRPLLPGVEARGDVDACPDEASYDRIFHGTQRGTDGKIAFLSEIPLPVSMDLMRRGQERFNVYCAPCHGLGGYGDGMTARRAAEMQQSGANTAAAWVAPTNYHTDEIRGRPVGNLYNTIANGIRTMPAYDKQIPLPDRWAIVAYVKALQRSQHAKPKDVPETEQDKYK